MAHFDISAGHLRLSPTEAVSSRSGESDGRLTMTAGEADMDRPQEFTFGQMPPAQTRWQSFAASYFVQVAMIAVIVAVTLSTPKIVLSQPNFQNVELIAPVEAPRVVAKVHPRVLTAPPKAQLRQIAPEQARVMPAPVLPRRVEVAKVTPPVIRQQPVPAPKFASLATNEPAMPKLARQVKMNTFGGSSAKPTLAPRAVAKVQTGGFGDPNGVPVNKHGSDRPNIAAVGSFDLPQGGGYGNGSGGRHGARGVIASAGFGNGVASATGGHGNGRPGRVQLASFGNGGEVAGTARSRASVQQQADTKPVTIESKPKPVYTAAALARRIEGEVLVKVTFTANGQVVVNHVIRGLGYGLDEAAIRAAQGIRFAPAERDGRAVDSTATLHIVFQLS